MSVSSDVPKPSPTGEGTNEPSGATEDRPILYEFADLGFDTGKKLWFVKFFSETNESVGTYFARKMRIAGGRAAQYEWKDAEKGRFWHVRERFFAADIESFSIDPGASTIELTFRREARREDDETAPADFSYLQYAFHLANKGEGERAPMGFVEFYDSKGGLLRRIDNRWIIIEDLDRTTWGEFPNIRIRVARGEVERLVVTRTAVVIQGRLPKTA